MGTPPLNGVYGNELGRGSLRQPASLSAAWGRGGGQKIGGGGVSGTPPQKGEPIGESWDAQGGERRGEGENGEPPTHDVYGKGLGRWSLRQPASLSAAWGRGGAKNWGGVSGTPPQKGDPIGESWDAQGGEGRGENGEPPSTDLYRAIWLY